MRHYLPALRREYYLYVVFPEFPSQYADTQIEACSVTGTPSFTQKRWRQAREAVQLSATTEKQSTKLDVAAHQRPMKVKRNVHVRHIGYWTGISTRRGTKCCLCTRRLECMPAPGAEGRKW